MKRAFIFILTTVLLKIVVFISCVENEDENVVSKITMITANSDNVKIYFGGSGKCTFDWGDGTSEFQILSSYPGQFYSHSYERTFVHTITITYEKITHIECNEKQFSSLNLSGCTTLKQLYCRDSQLMNLDLNGCVALESLTCYDTQLKNLDVSSCKALMFLRCYNNSQLTNLDVSGCQGLIQMSCIGSQLTNLDISVCTNLTLLNCNNNNLVNINVKGCKRLTSFFCRFNQLYADALDNLFRMLDSDAENKTIYIDGNPGIDDCNPSIATEKGWTFL